MTHPAPFGTWRSPVTLDTLVAGALALSHPHEAGESSYWLERRPAEGGRQVIVQASKTGKEPQDLFGPGYNARTLVHEYGGLCFVVSEKATYFSNFEDQRLYRVVAGQKPEAITENPEVARSVRFAAPVLAPGGDLLYAVRERHPQPDDPARVVNDVVAIKPDGSFETTVLAEGSDFYSHLAVAPDGSRLAFIEWDHPNMPWDATRLVEIELKDGLPVGERRLVAGGDSISITQPKFSPDGTLYFCSDETNWWNIYAAEAGQPPRAVVLDEHDFAGPDWVFGRSSYAFLQDGSIVASWIDRGFARLGHFDSRGRLLSEIKSAYSYFDNLRTGSDGESILAVGAGPSEPPAILRITPSAVSPLRASGPLLVDRSYISEPEPIEFPTAEGLSAHAFFYPPKNPDYETPEDEFPPLIVQGHGGPTSASPPVLDYEVQFWTTRGIGVVDVNYGGSTGFGRQYRERLKGNWGIVDVADCAAAAKYLADQKKADSRRLAIHGGSAGGYTALCALVFTDVFSAAASYFGVADAGALARETHKFESRYLDGLIGPWPEAQATYEERSPIMHLERLDVPLILFQGLEDKVVPPSQAEAMAAALDEKGVPYAYIAYEGEQHGFRRAENVRRTTEAELYFYSRVFSFVPADELEPVEIKNADALT